MAAAGVPTLLSYAGRTRSPRRQPVPMRVGGFGGAEGLAAFLRRERIARVIDATHPFAARISHNAVTACKAAGISLLALERPPWQPGEGDRWTLLPDLSAAAEHLSGPAQRVFLAIGRLHLDVFAAQPRHHYLLRFVDPPEGPLPVPDCTVEVARGPFNMAADRALLMRHRITCIVTKNAGGSGAIAKLVAARELGLPVLMVERPVMPARRVVATLDEAMHWLHADLGV